MGLLEGMERRRESALLEGDGEYCACACCKHDDPSLIPRAQIENTAVVLCACDPQQWEHVSTGGSGNESRRQETLERFPHPPPKLTEFITSGERAFSLVCWREWD